MLSNSQFHKLKPGIKNKAEVFLRLSSNIIGNSDNKINFPHELVLTNTEVQIFVKLLQITHHQKFSYLR